MEIWLPTQQAWNRRYVAYGGAGYTGGSESQSLTAVSRYGLQALVGATSGYVTSASDDGHGYGSLLNGSFAMLANGELNWTLLRDWAYGAQHEMAVKTKILIYAYYGSSPEFAYWNGTSTGGREGLMLAQRYPADFNGIISAYPAINWPSFVPGIMWPQVVMQQDLGGPISEAKLELVTTAAVNACDTQLTGQHDGYINDPKSCRYDPTKDKTLLCIPAGGENAQSNCLSLTEARAVNKIWFGPRIDGEMVDPAVDNGWTTGTLSKGQLWYGYPRGSLLHNSPHTFRIGAAGATPFTIGSDYIALTLRNPAFATESFRNETGIGQNLWRSIGYVGINSFPAIFAKSVAEFSELNATDNPDLREFSKLGGKVIHWHGLADNQIPPAGSIHYYERVRKFMGGDANTQMFYRFYLVPGMGHGFTSAPGVSPPIPGGNLKVGPNETLLPILRDWVERGVAPDNITASSNPSPSPGRTRSWCVYPKILKYTGGDVNTASSFVCS